MFPTSIRARMLGWLAGLMLVLLAGFGITAYRLQQTSDLRRVDDELERRVAQLQTDWRGSFPGPGGPDRSRTPLGPPPGDSATRVPPPAIGEAGADTAGPRATMPATPPPLPMREFDPTLRAPDFRPPTARKFTASSQTAALFANAAPDSYYYAVWLSRGTEVTKAPNTPADLVQPIGQRGRSYHRTREGFRELYQITERGDCLLAGISTASLQAANRRFAWSLLAGGVVVMLIALGGAWLIIQFSLQPVRDISDAATRIAAGDLSERIAVRNARSELGQLADVLNATFARLEAAFVREKHFTGDASHELRTPVAVILTETEHALSRERSAGEYRTVIEICRDTARRMRRLIDALLQLARFDAGEDPIRREPFDLAEVAQTTADVFRGTMENRQLWLVVEAAPALAVGDAERMGQVLTNLLQNALQHTPAGGEIRLRTRVEANHAVAVVEDTGAGIAPEDLPHVFKRFYRADKARSRSEGNSGLGLAICQAIVDAHGGSIGVESTPGHGATFTVRIPCAPVASSR